MRRSQCDMVRVVQQDLDGVHSTRSIDWWKQPRSNRPVRCHDHHTGHEATVLEEGISLLRDKLRRVFLRVQERKALREKMNVLNEQLDYVNDQLYSEMFGLR